MKERIRNFWKSKKVVNNQEKLKASEAHLLSDNFSCFEKAISKIRRKASLGYYEVCVIKLADGDIQTLKKLGYTVEEYHDGIHNYKISW